MRFADDAGKKGGVFGLAGDRFQVLYHFTMGGPIDDPRLQTREQFLSIASQSCRRRSPRST